MSGISSLFPSKFLPSMNPRDRQPDPLAHIRFIFETLPGAKEYVYSEEARAQVLSELYESLWGTYAQFFLPSNLKDVPPSVLLSECQKSSVYPGAGKEDEPIPGRPCGHIFNKGESCFRCKDCSLDDSCVLCSRCFRATSHEGHNVSFFIAQQSGGCCDCGDAEAWRAPIHCPFHPLAESSEDDERDAAQLATPKATGKHLPEETPTVKNYPLRVHVPPDLRDTMTRTIVFALDFILDTLDYSPDELNLPAELDELRTQVTGDPLQKDNYSVVLWNDEKHSFDEVETLLIQVCGKSLDEARHITFNIDDTGRDVVALGTDSAQLLEKAHRISQVDLGVTIRRAYDTFREQMSATIIEWLLDLTRCRLQSDAILLREIICSELLSPRKKDHRYFRSVPQALLAVQNVNNPNRLEWLFLYHIKLWKKPRLNLKEIYATTLTLSKEHKKLIAGHFARVYPDIIDSYLLVDREAETSIKYFALQLFTVPSCAEHVVKEHRLITRLLAIITSFFTNQITSKHITYPPLSGILVDVDSFPFKSKRFMPVFSDLRYLCQNVPVQALIARDQTYLSEFSKTCMLFMCIGPNKRSALSHVEYETDSWISVFNVTLSLARVIKTYGEAFTQASPTMLLRGISTVITDILRVTKEEGRWLDKEKFSAPKFYEVTFSERKYKIINFDVLEGWISFNHSLHWLLADLFKHVHMLGGEGKGPDVAKNYLFRQYTEQDMLIVIDYPLRVLALVAQIRNGLWVRNGFAIRGQLLHYRDYMLRELCYDQDLYLLQTSLLLLDPNLILVNILDRFGLRQYFSGAPDHDAYEGTQLSGMVEELLYVVITILSEKGHASHMTLPQAIRREIVHALAMGPCTFTDLTKRVAERLVEDVHFENVLKEVATFKVPESVSETGLYELKDEVFDEVNPFFYHYTRNKREEVETILKARLKKKGAKEPVIVPKPLGITTGPFSVLSSCFESEVLLQILYYALSNTLKLTDHSGSPPPSAEAILDQILHLVSLGIVEKPETFCHLAAHRMFDDQVNLVQVLCALEHHATYKTYQPKVGWILDELASRVGDVVVVHRKIVTPTDGGPISAEEKKRKAAKARQEAILLKMKEQQASFALNADEDEDDDDAMDVPVEEVSEGTCIVCQEDLNAQRPFGLLGLIQPSRMVRRYPDSQSSYLSDVLKTPPSLDVSTAPKSVVFPPPLAPPSSSTSSKSSSSSSSSEVHELEAFPSDSTRFGLYNSVCSHMMHLECFQTYTASVKQRHRAQATRNQAESVARKEYICPLCKSLGNCLLPFAKSPEVALSSMPFPDWIRAAGISILKSKPDPYLESMQLRTGTGEFVFWSAQDSGYSHGMKMAIEQWENGEAMRMVDTAMNITKTYSSQTRHLRGRQEPEPGDRGAGLYLPEELLGYTISAIEAALRGVGSNGRLVVESVTEAQNKGIRSQLHCLKRIAALHFAKRPDEGRDAIKQAIVKRLLPEWSRTSISSFSYPLLLRDPFTILVETAAVAPEMLRHVLTLTYYACLARTVIGMVYILNKTPRYGTTPVGTRMHEDIFGEVRIFFTSVVRHSPVFEHTANIVLDNFGEARIERLLYAFTLPFLRRAAILCHAILPGSFPPLDFGENQPCEYHRLLSWLGIPPLSDLPEQDTLQNALSGWCAHYGHSHAASQLNCGVVLDYPGIYRMVNLPPSLDYLFSTDSPLICPRCNTPPPDAAICLFCGTVCCMQSYCCGDKSTHERKGECNMHTRECSGIIGAYFLVKRCQILYLYAGNGSFFSSPYLDIHGEADVSMRRGRRQFLHPARWEDVRKTWLSHGIPHIVSRKLESTMDTGGWETL